MGLLQQSLATKLGNHMPASSTQTMIWIGVDRGATSIIWQTGGWQQSLIKSTIFTNLSVPPFSTWLMMIHNLPWQHEYKAL
jgi:hypothetical protein